MHLTIITGSHRTKGESTRVGRYVETQLKAMGHEVAFMDAGAMDVPFWDEGMWGVDGLKDKWAKLWAPHAATLQATDGVVVVAPEYAGMVPSKLKNVLLLCSAAELGHKPGMIVSVSSSINGAYPVAELRAHTVKNSKLVWTPEHIIVRNVADMLGAEVKGEHDQALRDRMAFALGVLVEYAKAFKPMRAGGKVMDNRYPYGM